MKQKSVANELRGRATRYEKRRVSRGSVAANAPQWSGPSAATAMAALSAIRGGACGARDLVTVVKDQALWRDYVAAMRRVGGRTLADLASSILTQHAADLRRVHPLSKAARAWGGARLKRMRPQALPASLMLPLELPATNAGPANCHEWLSADMALHAYIG